MLLLVSGSLRRDSYNTALLREAANALPSGVGHAWLDGIASLPHYTEDDDGERPPAAVVRLRRTIAAAGALLIATPEYNGSFPGSLKNALDWASRPFPDNALRDKPVAVIGASTGLFGAVWAQAQLRKSLDIAGARVVDAELAVGMASDAFLPTGALRDPGHATGLQDVVAALVSQTASGRCLHGADEPDGGTHGQQHPDSEGRTDRHLRRDGQADVPQADGRRAGAGRGDVAQPQGAELLVRGESQGEEVGPV